MTIKVSGEIIDRELTNGGELQPGEGVVLGVYISHEDECSFEEETYSKADFERDLRKASRKVKK